MTVDEARRLMEEWTQSPALRVHMEAVAACMGAYADKLASDQRDRWVVAGLLHDMDYERHPSQEAGHPFVAVEHLRGLGVDEEILTAILAHAEYSGTPRLTAMAKALFAVDELCGLITATALVQPGKTLAEVTADSVLRKMKKKEFARSVNREEIAQGAEELGVPLEEHVAFTLAALQAQAGALGL